MDAFNSKAGHLPVSSQTEAHTSPYHPKSEPDPSIFSFFFVCQLRHSSENIYWEHIVGQELVYAREQKRKKLVNFKLGLKLKIKTKSIGTITQSQSIYV